MELKGKTAVVTGGASGIGLAIARKFISEGVRVVISDINEVALTQQASAIGATGIPANVAVEADIRRLVEAATAVLGGIDIFVSNAGIAKFGGVDTDEATWNLTWHVNVMSQVYAAKYVLPQMIARGSGYILNTASAAGLLVEFHSVLYSTTKHASIGLSEWLAADCRDSGVTVSVLCPGPVRTPMAAGVAAMQEDALEPEEVAEMVIQGMAKKQFMINTHEKIWKLYQVKGQDYEKYMDLLVGRRAYKLGLDNKKD